MTLVDSLYVRLRAGLDVDVPVLRPSEIRVPLDAAPLDDLGRPAVGGGERGLGAYLKAHQQGYVQLRHGDGLISDGITDTGMLSIDVVALELRQAQALAELVRAFVGSVPAQPTPFTFSLSQTFEESGCARLILTFQTRNIGVYYVPRKNPEP